MTSSLPFWLSEIGGDAAFGNPLVDEGLELLAPIFVHHRSLVGGEERRSEVLRLRGSLRSAGLGPRLVVAPVADHRLVERSAESLLSVADAEEVSSGANLLDGVDCQCGVV